MDNDRFLREECFNMPKVVGDTSQKYELSIVLPCLDEEQTIGICVKKSTNFLKKNKIKGEVIVADNGSTDRSRRIASSLGATVIQVENKGYGSAVRGGIDFSRGKYIIMADADDSYELDNLMPFLEKLREGYDLVMGNRFKGGIRKGAMPWHHQYIGNPLLSFTGKLFFKTPAGDFHSGLRAFTKAAAATMNLQTTGMEFASEIVIKSSILNMRVCEVPTVLFPDGRTRRPHLRSFRDGWRHLRFLLLFSPRWLFAYPGMALIIIGAAFSVVLSFGPLQLPYRLVDFHSFIISGTLMILGINLLAFYAITRVYTFNNGLLPKPPEFFPLFKIFNLEKGLFVGFALLIIGVSIIAYAAYLAQMLGGFETIGFGQSVRLVFGGSLAVILGAQAIFTSFVLSMLGMRISRQ
jgi:glycosyltransferase involved in cell wall biosynthesis